MEGTMSEIRIFAGNFAPRTWAFCQGQTLAVSTNQALYSLLGTIYGGDGIQTFQLPDLRSRVPVGTGPSSSGDLNVVIGQIGGEENHTLTTSEIPSHTHKGALPATLTAPPPPIAFYASSDPADSPNPVGNLFGETSGSNLAIYADDNVGTVPMANNELSLSVTLSGNPALVFQATGASMSHPNMQPYIAANYVICLLGIFPSRN